MRLHCTRFADKLKFTHLKCLQMLCDQAEPLPPEIEPLVLWEPPEGEEGQAVEVDARLTKCLRPHQREGVKFLFECVTGQRSDGQGDDSHDSLSLLPWKVATVWA